jgi:hypothetical protein
VILIGLLIFVLIIWPVAACLCLGILKLLGFKSNPDSPAKILISIFAPFAIIALLYLVGRVSERTVPSKDDIIGTYEIDRSFFPGPNADWQHATYEFKIGEDFASIRDARTNTTRSYPIEWTYRYHWNFAHEGKRHHMISDGPTIYRHTFSHSYIFHSPLYGNVKFKKKSHGFWKWFAAGIAVLLICKALWPKHDLSRWLNISRFRIRPPSL